MILYSLPVAELGRDSVDGGLTLIAEMLAGTLVESVIGELLPEFTEPTIQTIIGSSFKISVQKLSGVSP